MKLQGEIVIFVLGVVGLASMASGLCLLKNTAKPKLYRYHCFLSNDYLTDVKSAPIDIPQLTFSNSLIPVLRNKSFSRLSKDLEILEINFCETRDIEDNAFEGLAKLQSLDVGNNNLQIIKGVWFQGLSNLQKVSFQNNEIKHIEASFYSITPPLDSLDITGNQLTCFPMPSPEVFKVKKIGFRYNPVSWECVAALINWVEKTGVEYDEFGRGHWDPSSELVWHCAEKLGKSLNQLDDETMTKCAEKTVNDFSPPQENYTIKQLCQYLKDKPSPFLICSQ